MFHPIIYFKEKSLEKGIIVTFLYFFLNVVNSYFHHACMSVSIIIFILFLQRCSIPSCTSKKKAWKRYNSFLSFISFLMLFILTFTMHACPFLSSFSSYFYNDYTSEFPLPISSYYRGEQHFLPYTSFFITIVISKFY